VLQLIPVLIAISRAVVPFMHEEHNKLVDAINMVSVAYYAEEFGLLREELEAIYLNSGEGDPSRDAFRDALYAIICERDG